MGIRGQSEKKNLKFKNFKALPKGQLCTQERESKSFFDFPPVLFPEPKTKLKIINVLYVLSVWDCTIISNVLSTGRCFEL